MKTKKQYIRIVLIGIISGINLLYPQSVDELLEMSLEDLANVEVVTASKTLRSSRDITQKIDVITKKQIERTVIENRNISEVVQYYPGAAVKVLSRNFPNWGAYGGIGPKYSTYMLQGLPVDAFTDPMNLEIMAIERIEIQRGPASVLYPNFLSQDFAGNQAPLAGTVNLILKEEVVKPLTRFSLGYGAYNTWTAKGYHENYFGKLHFITGASYELSDYTDYKADGNTLKNPEYQKGKAFVGANLFLDQKKVHKLNFFGNQTLHAGDEGRKFREYNHGYSLGNVGYTGAFTEDITLSFKTGLRWYDREWDSDKYDSLTQKYEPTKTSGVDQLIVPSDISLSYRHYNNSNLTFGSDYQTAYYMNWEKPLGAGKQAGNEALVSQFGLYLQEELQIYNLVVRGGLRYNYINYNIDKIGGSVPVTAGENWSVLLWSAGLKYKINKEFTLFSNGGNSFMSPALKPIGGTISGNNVSESGQLPNPDLDPESGRSFDFGFDYTLPVNVRLSSRVFYTSITNAIIDNVVSNTPSRTMSINAEGETTGKGIEFSVQQKVETKLDWFANITYTRSEIIDPDSVNLDGIEVPFVPALMGNIGITFFLPYGIEVSPWMHFGGEVFDSNKKSDRSTFDSRELLNIRVNKELLLKNGMRFNFYTQAYNVTNNEYTMPWQFKDPGISFSGGANFIF
ncbi:MAG: TonB-dependent receptor [Fibrobacteria bacterium]|nr:TonB-dependent receptor [Fibrobacteria bacterium]